MMSRLCPLTLLLCLALGSLAQQQTSERGLPPTSPCPAVYSYGWDPAGGWHGLITIIPPARYSEVQLVLRMTVPYYRPDAGVGRVEIKGGNAEIQAISRRAYRGERKQVQFIIIFPPFDNVPRVKEIYINNKKFCMANQVYADTRSTIELKYTLRTGLNMPVSNGNDFSIAGTTPSRPDLVTIAILQPMDEARPMVSSPAQPSSQRPFGPKPPCNCNKTKEEEDYDHQNMPLRPDNHVFHAFKPPTPAAGGGNNHGQYENDVLTTSTPASVNRPTSGGTGGNGFGSVSNNPSSGVNQQRPGISGGNGFGSGNNNPSSGVNQQRPGISGGNGFGSGINNPASSINQPRPINPEGNGIYAKPSRPSMGGDRNTEVDDKIYFIQTNSDDVNSPRIVKLLEHLLIVTKKHYRIALERLEIEKKRLALESQPHYTFVV